MKPSPTTLQALLAESDWLLRVCRALTRCSADADDLAQDVLGAAMARTPGVEGPGTSIRGWLGTVARRRAARMSLRASSRDHAEASAAQTARTVDPGGASLQERTHDLAVLQRELAGEIARLPEEDRTVLVMRFLESRPYDEIAEQLRVSEDAARQRCSRALRVLRGRLEKEDERWSRWLPAIAGGTFVSRQAGTQERAFTSGGQARPIAAAVAVTLSSLAGWQLLGSPSSHVPAPLLGGASTIAPAQAALALDVSLAPTDSREALAATIASSTPSKEIRFQIVTEAGDPIVDAQALWCEMWSEPVECQVDESGHGRAAPRDPAQVGALFVVAPGYLGQTFRDLECTESAPRVLTLATAPAIEIRVHVGESLYPGLPETVMVRLATFDEDPLPGGMAASLHRSRWLGSFEPTALTSIGEGRFTWTPRIAYGRAAFDLPDDFRVVSATAPAIPRQDLTDPGQFYFSDVVLDLKDAALIDSPVEITAVRLPHSSVRFTFEDGRPFSGSVESSKVFSGAVIDRSGFIRADAEGVFQVATVHHWAERQPNLSLEAVSFVFLPDESIHLSRMSVDPSDMAGGHLTRILERPRPYQLSYFRATGGDRHPVEARAIGERGIRQPSAPDQPTTSEVHHGLPGEVVSVVADGYAIENVTLPAAPLDSTQPTLVDVELAPHPMLEIRVDPERMRGGRITLASADGSSPRMKFVNASNDEAARLAGFWTHPTQYDFAIEPDGVTRIAGVRAEHDLRLKVRDALGSAIIDRTCRLGDSPVNMVPVTSSLKRVRLRFMEETGTPIEAGYVTLDKKRGTNPMTAPFFRGELDLGVLLPGRYWLTARDSRGELSTAGRVEFRVKGTTDGTAGWLDVDTVVLTRSADH